MENIGAQEFLALRQDQFVALRLVGNIFLRGKVVKRTKDSCTLDPCFWVNAYWAENYGKGEDKWVDPVGFSMGGAVLVSFQEITLAWQPKWADYGFRDQVHVVPSYE